jgi:transposase
VIIERKYRLKVNSVKHSPIGIIKHINLKLTIKDGRINIDNNRAERAVKPFVIGRKNGLFSNTARGAKASANLYSFVETAKANGLMVDIYLQTCLDELAKNPDNLEYLLPWNINQG